ncbi:unnamed protein product [Cuscuta campestris]|uniref:Uncharacterized protein n=1 Tax=Cuscuta campestris TaxID=132261 RepID=A0A484NI18_9ASTE|nr:unnamed protein product [Cuscuta campestris]
MPSLIPIELYIFKTTMMRSIRKLIGTPRDLAPAVAVQNTTLQDQEFKKEIFINPIGVPDDDLIIDPIDVVPVTVDDVVVDDVSGDDQQDHTVQAEYSRDSVIFYECTETFGTSGSDVVVLYDSGDVKRDGMIFFLLVLWSCLLGVVNALSLTDSFDAPFIKEDMMLRDATSSLDTRRDGYFETWLEKLIGYPEGWIFRDQAGRGRGNNRGRGNFRGPGRGAGRSTVGAGRSTVTGGRSEVHAVQGEGPSPLPNFEDLTSEQWNAVRHALSLSSTDNSQKLSGGTPREDALRSNSATDYFEDAEELSTEDHLDRSWRNGRLPGNGDAEELQTVDSVDRADDHGRPSGGQNDGSSGEDPTVDRAMEDGRPSSRQKLDAPAQLQTVDSVDRSTDGG